MIAYEKVDRNTTVAQFRQLAQSAHKAFGDNCFVLKLKVEKVAEEEYGTCIGFDVVKPLHKLRFTGFAFGSSGRSEVIIGGEVYLFIFR